MLGTKRIAAVCASSWLFCGALCAQDLVHTFTGGGTAGNGLGQCVRAAGDVDGDGFDDVIAGYRIGSSAAGANAGSARVWSGADGLVLHTFVGDSANDQLGRSVDGAGDIDGDGHADLIVGAAGDDSNGLDSGTARVYSGASGAVLYTAVGPFSRARFGWAVAGVGDVDGDGRADFAASGQPDPNTPQPIGFVRIYSGATGAMLREVIGSSSVSRLGAALAGAGDVDGDGVPDWIAGDWRDATHGNLAGAARVFSGADGSQILAFFGSELGDRLGTSVDGAGDVDGDGRADLIAGAPWADAAVNDTGLAYVWSGADGALLYSLAGDTALDFFGAAVAGVRDVDADGFDDFAVGAYADDMAAQNDGSARIYSGADGHVLHTLGGDSAADELGYALAGVGDVNGDGGFDFAVAAPVDNAGGGSNTGSVRVYAGVPPPDVELVHAYCVTTPNSVGPGAIMSWSGSTSFTANDLVMTVTGVPPRGPALFFFGAEPTQTPLFQGVLCVKPPLKRLSQPLPVGSDGSASYAFDLASGKKRTSAIQPGTIWNFQVLYFDFGVGRKPAVNLSDALEATFVP